MATHSSILAEIILWTEEPGRQQSIASQRVGHYWSDLVRRHAPTEGRGGAVGDQTQVQEVSLSDYLNCLSGIDLAPQGAGKPSEPLFLSIKLRCCICPHRLSVQFSSAQSLSQVWLLATPWTAACKASLSITNSRSLFNSCPLSWWCYPTTSSSVVPSPPTFNFSQHQVLFKQVSSHQVAKVLELQPQHYQSFQWIFRTDVL